MALQILRRLNPMGLTTAQLIGAASALLALLLVAIVAVWALASSDDEDTVDSYLK